MIFKKLRRSLKVIYYVLNNNFFYTQLAFAFVPQKDSYYAFFLFLLQQNFDIDPFFAFCFFLLQKDFDIFHVLLFGFFLYVFDNSHFLIIFISFLFMEKNILFALKINFSV